MTAVNRYVRGADLQVGDRFVPTAGGGVVVEPPTTDEKRWPGEVRVRLRYYDDENNEQAVWYDAAGWLPIVREVEESTTVKFPEVEVVLTGEDGNAFAIMGRVRKALERAGVPTTEIEAFTAEATGGNYDHLLQTVMKWVATS